MDFPRRQFLQLAAGGAALSALSRTAGAQAPTRRDRCTPNRHVSHAGSAATSSRGSRANGRRDRLWSANSSSRTEARLRRQYRDRVRGESTAGRVHAAGAGLDQRGQRDAL